MELPYEGDEFSLILILPGEGVKMEEVEKLLSAHRILKWSSEINEKTVEISIPRLVMLFHCNAAYVRVDGDIWIAG